MDLIPLHVVANEVLLLLGNESTQPRQVLVVAKGEDVDITCGEMTATAKRPKDYNFTAWGFEPFIAEMAKQPFKWLNPPIVEEWARFMIKADLAKVMQNTHN